MEAERERDEILREFQAMATGPEKEIRLDRGALLVARSEYPGLDAAHYLSEFDRLSARVRRKLPGALEPLAAVRALNSVLIEEEGYRGNEDDYYDPRNSYVNDVMDRKLGIPITLSLIYLEVARRLRFPLSGVSFPGHFLVRHRSENREIYLDPFNRGEILLPRDLPARLAGLFGERTAKEVLKKSRNRIPDAFVADAAPRYILIRMLSNLREIYLRRQDLHRSRRVVAMLLLLGPDPAMARASLTAIRKVEAALN